MLRRLPIVVGMVLAAVLGPAAAQAEQSRPAGPRSVVQFTLIYYDPPGRADGRNKLNRELVVIKNRSCCTVNLRGWTIRDRNGHVYRFTRDFKLATGAAVDLHSGHGKDTRVDIYWHQKWYVWDDRRDTAFLRDARGRLIDMCAYVGTPRGFTYC